MQLPFFSSNFGKNSYKLKKYKPNSKNFLFTQNLGNMLKIKWIPLFFLLPLLLQAQERVLVISGGGAKGAWGGGLAQYLVEERGHDYKFVVGASTGSLLAPLIALEEFDALEEAYTSITDKDIFNVLPYKTKGPKRGQIRGTNALMRILTGKKTLGESKNLRKTIKKFYPPNLYERLRDSEKDQIITVVNLTEDRTEYKSVSDNQYDYEQIVDWMWASASVPMFMSLYKTKNADGVRQFYVDGGIKEGVPLQKGLELACNENLSHIDIIIHNTLDPKSDNGLESGGVMKFLTRTIELFLTEIRKNDLTTASRESLTIKALNCNSPLAENDLTITYYFMTKEDINIISNELLFSPTEMKKLWQNGYDHYNRKSNDTRLANYRIEVHVPRSQFCTSN